MEEGSSNIAYIAAAVDSHHRVSQIDGLYTFQRVCQVLEVFSWTLVAALKPEMLRGEPDDPDLEVRSATLAVALSFPTKRSDQPEAQVSFSKY